MKIESSYYLDDWKSIPDEEVKQNRDDRNDGKKSDSNDLFFVCCVKFILCDSPKSVKKNNDTIRIRIRIMSLCYTYVFISIDYIKYFVLLDIIS